MAHTASTRSGVTRTLVVDDDHDGAESLAVLLRALGCEARALYRATDLVQECISFRPDIIFLDILIPGVNGPEAARRVRCDPAFERVWLVALSGSHAFVQLRAAFAAGFDAYYLKPIDPAALSTLLALSSKDRSAIGFILDPRLAPVLASIGARAA